MLSPRIRRALAALVLVAHSATLTPLAHAGIFDDIADTAEDVADTLEDAGEAVGAGFQEGWKVVSGGVGDAARITYGGVTVALDATGRAVEDVAVQTWSGISGVGQRTVRQIEVEVEKGIQAASRGIHGGLDLGDQAVKQVVAAAEEARQWVKDNERLLIEIGFEVACALIIAGFTAVGAPGIGLYLTVGLRMAKARYVDKKDLTPQEIAILITENKPVLNVIAREQQNIRRMAQAALKGDFEEMGDPALAIGTTSGRVALRAKIKRKVKNPRTRGALLIALSQYERDLAYADLDLPPPQEIRIDSKTWNFVAKQEKVIRELQASGPSRQDRRCLEAVLAENESYRKSRHREALPQPTFPGLQPLPEMPGQLSSLIPGRDARDRALGDLFRAGCVAGPQDFLDKTIRRSSVGDRCFAEFTLLHDLLRTAEVHRPDLDSLRREKREAEARQARLLALNTAQVVAKTKALEGDLRGFLRLGDFYRKEGAPVLQQLDGLRKSHRRVPRFLRALERSPFETAAERRRLRRVSESLPEAVAALSQVKPQRLLDAGLEALLRRVEAASVGTTSLCNALRLQSDASWIFLHHADLQPMRQWEGWTKQVLQDKDLWLGEGIQRAPARLEAEEAELADLRASLAKAVEAQERRLTQEPAEFRALARVALESVPTVRRVLISQRLALRVEAKDRRRYLASTPVRDAGDAEARRWVENRLQEIREKRAALRETIYEELPKWTEEVQRMLDSSETLEARGEEVLKQLRRASAGLADDAGRTRARYRETLGPRAREAARAFEDFEAAGARRTASLEKIRRLLAGLVRGAPPAKGALAQELETPALRALLGPPSARADLLDEARLQQLQAKLAELRKELARGRQEFGLRALEVQREIQAIRARIEARRRQREADRKRREEEQQRRLDASIGLTVEGIHLSASSRWDTAKGHLSDGLRGYVTSDISRYMRMFSRNSILDLAILRNAAQEDFQADASINVDVQLLAYRFQGEDLSADLRWNRNSTENRTGTVRVETGTASVLFDRADDFRVQGWFGSTPFGRRSQALAQQVRAGNPNDQTGVQASTSPAPTSTASPPPRPPIQTVSATLDLSPNTQALVDFDGQTIRAFGGSATPTASEDAHVQVTDFGGPGQNTVQLTDAQGSGNVTGSCSSISDLSQAREVVEANLTTTTQVHALTFFAFKTVEGRFVLGEGSYDNAGLLTLRYRIGDAPLVDSQGTLTCP